MKHGDLDKVHKPVVLRLLTKEQGRIARINDLQGTLIIVDQSKSVWDLLCGVTGAVFYSGNSLISLCTSST